MPRQQLRRGEEHRLTGHARLLAEPRQVSARPDGLFRDRVRVAEPKVPERSTQEWAEEVARGTVGDRELWRVPRDLERVHIAAAADFDLYELQVGRDVLDQIRADLVDGPEARLAIP